MLPSFGCSNELLVFHNRHHELINPLLIIDILKMRFYELNRLRTKENQGPPAPAVGMHQNWKLKIFTFL